MTRVPPFAFAMFAFSLWANGCGSSQGAPAEAAEDPSGAADAADKDGESGGGSASSSDGRADGGRGSTRDGGTSVSGGGTRSGGTDSGANNDARAPSSDDAAAGSTSSGGPADATSGAPDGGSTSGGTPDTGGSGQTCDLPTTFKWTSDGPLAQPKNGWLSMKDFTHVFYNNQHIVYFTTYKTGWGSGMMTFKDWPDAAAAPQTMTSFGVAPTLFYFRPKSVWVLAYQWGPHKFSYRTSTDPTNPDGWSAEKSLYNTALPSGGTGPIDQTVICDSAKCYLYYAGDNGHIYRSSLPIANFPGEFPAADDSGIAGTSQDLFEAVQVYALQGSNKYLMIVEAQGSGRYFRAWTATSLAGPWTLLTNDFAIKKNVTFSMNWTNDISHGDIVRTNPDETFTIDPCNLQLVFQGRDPNVNVDYGQLPYRLGLLRLAH